MGWRPCRRAILVRYDRARDLQPRVDRVGAEGFRGGRKRVPDVIGKSRAVAPDVRLAVVLATSEPDGRSPGIREVDEGDVYILRRAELVCLVPLAVVNRARVRPAANLVRV